MNFIVDMLSFPFIRRALLVGIFVSLCAALLGVSLVLKRFSMIGDGLSHVSFGALSVALAFGWAPLQFSSPVVAVAAFFLLRITERANVKSDAAIAVVSAASLAIGIIVTSLKTGINTDVASYMFGSILAIGKEDVWVSLILSIAVLGLFALCYHRIFAITFDENFAQATGVSVSFYNTLIAILTAITVVLGMRMMGALLISSLIIFPALSSMRLFKRFSLVVLCAAILSVVCFCAGMAGSYQFDTPVGASVVVANLVIFLLFSLIQKIREYAGKKKVQEIAVEK